MSEIHVMVEQVPECGYLARAVGMNIFTEADDLEQLRARVGDAVRCHFEPGERPSLIRLYISSDEGLPA